MDPDIALTELRVLVSRVITGSRLTQADVDRGAELFDGLDTWLMNGGFLPKDWREHHRPLVSDPVIRARPEWCHCPPGLECPVPASSQETP